MNETAKNASGSTDWIYQLKFQSLKEYKRFYTDTDNGNEKNISTNSSESPFSSINQFRNNYRKQFQTSSLASNDTSLSILDTLKNPLKSESIEVNNPGVFHNKSELANQIIRNENPQLNKSICPQNEKYSQIGKNFLLDTSFSSQDISRISEFQTDSNLESYESISIASQLDKGEESFTDQDGFKMTIGEKELRRKYVFQGKIGEGSYSVVNKGLDLDNGCAVALKFCTFEANQGIPGTVMREISLLRSLKHDNIVKIRALHFFDRTVVLVVDLAPFDLNTFRRIYQSSLCPTNSQSNLAVKKHDWNRRMMKFYGQKTWNLKTVRDIGKQLFDAVSYLHSNQIIHRDLKPQNILIYPKTKQIKLIDFGLSNIDYAKCEMSKSVITLWYRPLELMLGAQNYGSYVDIWSCGIIYYEMLRSITPCQEKNRNEQTNSLIDKFDACRADFEAFDIPRKMLKKLKRMRTNVKKDIIHRILKIKSKFQSSTFLIEPEKLDKEILRVCLEVNPLDRAKAADVHSMLLYENEMKSKNHSFARCT